MINLIEGKINLGEKNISAASDYEDLNVLAEQGLVEKREMTGGRPYYYVEAVEDSMRFGVFVTLREKRSEWIVLRWLDGPCTSKGWDGISEKALKDEYRQLLNFVEKRVGGQPSNKRSRQRTWRLKWGQVDVSYEPRDFAVAIFLTPR
jgi:hypothetical protein